MKKNLQNYRIYPYVIFGLITMWIVYDVYATSTGRATRTSTLSDGCGSPSTGCHGNNKNTATSLSLTGNLNVEANSVTNFTISVSNAERAKAGINVAVKTSITGEDDGGTLTEGMGMKKILNELTHDSPMDISGGKADFSFTWTAPSLPGTYYLRAIGNAVNFNNSADNQDQWNWMDVKTLTVMGIALTDPVGGQNLCAGSAYTIKWKAAGISAIKIELSSDGGSNFTTTLIDNFDPTGGAWTWNIPAGITQGSNFRIKISDVANPSKYSISPNNFNIYGPFSIKTHPKSSDICLGGDLTLNVEVTGTGVNYEWRKNGSPIPDANTPSYTITNANSSHAGLYGCLITSPCGSAKVTNDAEVNVRALTKIKTQPISRAVCKGENVTFEVIADGHFNKYQWYKDGIERTNDTLSKLTIPNVENKDFGKYWVTVSGFCKPDLKSDEVTLSMNEAPVISVHPNTTIVCEKAKVELSVTSSAQELSYQWRKNGQNIEKGTSQKLTITTAALSDAGSYDCIVSNTCGADTSNISTLTINPLPKFTKNPANITILEGSNATFEVEAQNADSYQWRKNNANLPDETNPKLVIFGATPNDAGNYDCVIKNDCGSVTSTKGALTVDKPTPGPRVQFSDMKLDFGKVIEKKMKDSLFTSVIRNNGTDTLKIKKINIWGTNSTDFETTPIEQEIHVPIDSTIDLPIKFTANGSDERIAFIEIISNSVTNPDTLDLVGFGAIFDIRPNMKTLDFFDVFINDSSKLLLRLTNLGNYSEDISEYQIENGNGEFSIEPIYVVPDKDFIELPIWFKPKTESSTTAQLHITFVLADTTIIVNLHGEGVVNSVIEKFDNEFVNVFPNPTSNNTIIKLNNYDFSSFELVIFNIDGEKIRNFGINDLQNNDTIIWDGMNSEGISVAKGKYIGLMKIDNKIGTISIILE